MRPIYLDHHATTPLDRRVLDAMMPYLKDEFGNAASSEHRYGWVAEEAVKQARESIACHLNARAKEIVFTSGATESNNLAIFGVAERYASKGNHIITVATEHKAVLDPIAVWCKRGGQATVLPVDGNGLIDLDQLRDAILPETILISVMTANNEIGVIQPIAEIGAIAREHGVLFHTDATQAVGKIPMDVQDMKIDLLSMSAHKIYGPKGVGALYINRRRPRVQLTPRFEGGGHEGGFRSGTLNVPGLVGLAAALDLCIAELPSEQARQRRLRDYLLAGLREARPDLIVNGHLEQRLAGSLNVCFPGIDVAKLVPAIYARLAVSSGAACTSANPSPSHVLLALGGGREMSSLRFGLGRTTTQGDIQEAIQILRDAL